MKNIKLIAFSALIIFSVPQEIHGMENLSKFEEKAHFSGIQFSEETADTLQPDLLLQRNQKRNVERRRSHELIIAPQPLIMKQDMSPHVANPHSLSKLKEDVIEKGR